MPIKQLSFNTSPNVHTRKDSGIGVGLASLIIGGATAMSQYTTTQDELTMAVQEEDSKKADELAKLTYYDMEYSRNLRLEEFTKKDRTAGEMINFYQEERANNQSKIGLLTDQYKMKFDENISKTIQKYNLQRIEEEKKLDKIFMQEQSKVIKSKEDAENILTLLNYPNENSRKELFSSIAKEKTTKLKAMIESGLTSGKNGSQIVDELLGDLQNEKDIQEFLYEFSTDIKKVNDQYNLQMSQNKLKENIKNGVPASLLGGTSASGGSGKDANNMLNDVIKEYIENGEYNNAIRLSNINAGAKIKYFDDIVDSIFSNVQEPSIAIKYYKAYNQIKDGYMYEDKVKDKIEVLEAVAEYHKLDLNTENGMNASLNALSNKIDKETEGYKINSASVDDYFPTLRLFTNFSSEDKALVLREAKKLEGYLPAEKAVEYAVNKIKSAYSPDDTIVQQFNEPIGLIGARTEADYNALNTALNINNEEDFEYSLDRASGLWYVKINDSFSVYTNDQMKAQLRKGKDIQSALDISTKLIEKKKTGSFVGDSSDERIKNMENFFDSSIDRIIKENNLFNGISEDKQEPLKKFIQIEALRAYKDKIIEEESNKANKKRLTNEFKTPYRDDFADSLLGKIFSFFDDEEDTENYDIQKSFSQYIKEMLSLENADNGIDTVSEPDGAKNLFIKALESNSPVLSDFGTKYSASVLSNKYDIPIDTIEKVIKIESNGDYEATSGLSTAYGKYQFIDSTLKSTRKLIGSEETEKPDPIEQEELFIALTSQNIDGLKKNGMEVTPLSIYLAHQQGLGTSIGLTKMVNLIKEKGDNLSDKEKESIIDVANSRIIQNNLTRKIKKDVESLEGYEKAKETMLKWYSYFENKMK